MTPQEKKNGLICSSDGNLAQVVAYFCKYFQIHGWSVVLLIFRNNHYPGSNIYLEGAANKEVRERICGYPIRGGLLRGCGEGGEQDVQREAEPAEDKEHG